MREQSDRAGVPAIHEHGRRRPGMVVLVAASVLLVVGAVAGGVLIVADGNPNATSVTAGDPGGAQRQADGGTADRGGAGNLEERKLPLPPLRFMVPPLPVPDEESTSDPNRRADDRSSDENRHDASDESDGSEGSDESDGSDTQETGEPTPEPTQEPAQPKPRVSVLTTEADGGFATGVHIMNESDRPLTWTMQLTYDNVQVTGGWAADVQQSGGELTIQGKDRTATIPPGEQAVFGYHLTGAVQQPTDCTLNGKPCRMMTQR